MPIRHTDRNVPSRLGIPSFSRPRFVIAAILIAFAVIGAALQVRPQAPQPVVIYVVAPDPGGFSVTVTADFDLPSEPPVLKDFGQLQDVRAFVDGVEAPLTVERRGDEAVLNGLLGRGRARIEATLFCVTDPPPGYRKRLMGWPGGLMAREGLFLRLPGRGDAPVEIRWDLPPDWTLGLGREGVQTWRETQQGLWIAGESLTVREIEADGRSFRVVVSAEVDRVKADGCIAAAEAAFGYAAAHFGELATSSFGLAVFPRERIHGGTALGPSIAAEADEATAVHELLHWWTNHRTPAWFREGVHTYMAAKILALTGRMDEAAMAAYLETRLAEHRRVLRDEGALRSIVDSSRAYDRNEGGGDMYGLAPLAAAALDREVMRHTGGPGLEKVFAAVCRERTRPFDPEDILALIRTKTGYDPGPFFRKFFEKPITKPEALLKAAIPAAAER